MKNTDSNMRHFTRGGQTLLHTIRMMNQIMNRIGIFIVLFFVIFTLGMTYISLTSYEIYILKSFATAKFQLLINKNAYQNFLDINGHSYHVHSRVLIDSVLFKQELHAINVIFIHYILQGAFLSFAGMLLIYRWLTKRGKDQTQTQSLRGDEIAEQKVVAKKILKSREGSEITLAGLPMPSRFECRHVLVHGTTGSGKSVCIRELLDQIRKRGDRVIIYDKSCSYIQNYYQASDVILNPLDERGASWHLWNECRDSADYDSLAAALIPLPLGSSDPFWITAARLVFAAGARQMQSHKDRSMKKLLDILLNSDLATIQLFLKGTEAETIMSQDIEKVALSVKSVLATYLKSLSYVKDKAEAESFSIRSWIQDDAKSNWLFVSSLSDRHETLKPLISMWLDLASNALMSLPPSETRRIWIILDELPTLQRLPYLPECFAESRKFGGCLVAGMQSISQLRKIYGPHASEEISGLCNTRLFFREPSYETAQWVSRELGAREIEEVKEGMSYGENAMRAGISMSSQHSNRLLVHPSDIMRLNNLEAYIRLPGQLPITKLKFLFKNRETIADPYVPRVRDDLVSETVVVPVASTIVLNESANSNIESIRIEEIKNPIQRKQPIMNDTMPT